MTDRALLISAEALEQRRSEIRRSDDLRAIEANLRADLDRVLAHPLHVPEEKALLSRWGAACRDDEAPLAFDPFSPGRQRCTRCGRVWETEQTRRWWIYWYQLWLAERVLLMALFSGDGGPIEKRAIETLGLIAERYPKYPNADNVLGPARPFFSTYLESIWILHLSSAFSLLRDLGVLSSSLESLLVSSVFRPCAAIIADFSEGRSNRQVWNAAALFALGRVLGDEAMAREASQGDAGILASLRNGVLDDGLWYEGENYHWFAMRGLTWGAQLLRSAGEADLWNDEGGTGPRFRKAFEAPVLTALPDFTFPARRDSKFGVSLRQRRMAELWESAQAHGRTSAPGFASLLRFVYDESIPAAESHGMITDVERPDEKFGGLRRADLGWKGLLYAAPELQEADPNTWRPGSVHLESTGLAIFRRDEGSTYVSLDYGESGGGHGHPDRLHLTLVAKDVPWLLDFGTASYVAPSLAWYRSTLVHNAPLVDGHSQALANGHCVAHDEQVEYAWVCATLPEGSAYDGTTIQRTIVATPGYLLDVVQMGSTVGDRQLAVPWHGLGQPLVDDLGITFDRSSVIGHPSSSLRVLLGARQPFQVLVQKGAGPPAADGAKDMEYAIVFANGEAVTLAACIDLGGGPEEIECVDDDFIVRFPDGSVHAHRATDHGWQIELDRGDPIDLGGLRPEPEVSGVGDLVSGMSVPGDRFVVGAAQTPDTRHPTPPPAARIPTVRTEAPTLTLDRADQFRRAEDAWQGADAFSARAWLWHDGESLHVVADVTGEPLFRHAETPDPEWENENPDIHGAGLQVYVEGAGFYGWLIVPDDCDQDVIRVAAVRGTDGEPAMITNGGWEATATGYRVWFMIAVAEELSGDIGFDLLVNQARQGRERRAGQLVWSGTQGARLYLAGDRAPNIPLPRLKLG